MRSKSRALAALVTASLVLAVPVAGATAKPPKLKLPATFARWAHVALCEEGGWNVPGGNYPDPEGIDARNWALVHGPRLPLGHLSLKWQIVATRTGDRFIAYLRSHGYPHQQIPDPGGSCAAW